ncbi:hypothetical protein OTT_1687 [Orientia tsutsugamushi str. Ikeda]|uniref:Uncharacterized protein n=1 Tax=Orientia tsutsugamushi (strain Ikeda) TaxID=334380 RepID=B3CUU8_ORITI|nr:hypothetical protein OTT_1687 [Orientia tsutsugamushi str. Ikeda]
MSLIFTNSLMHVSPVVENFWIFTSLSFNLFLPTIRAYRHPLEITPLWLLCSPFGFSSNVLLSTFYYYRYFKWRKACYMVELASPSITALSQSRLIYLILTLPTNLAHHSGNLGLNATLLHLYSLCLSNFMSHILSFKQSYTCNFISHSFQQIFSHDATSSYKH